MLCQHTCCWNFEPLYFPFIIRAVLSSPYLVVVISLAISNSNRAKYRLMHAMGQPAALALPQQERLTP